MVCWTLRGCMHSFLKATSGARQCLTTSLQRARHHSRRFMLPKQGPHLSMHCMSEVAACCDQQVAILLYKTAAAFFPSIQQVKMSTPKFERQKRFYTGLLLQ